MFGLETETVTVNAYVEREESVWPRGRQCSSECFGRVWGGKCLA